MDSTTISQQSKVAEFIRRTNAGDSLTTSERYEEISDQSDKYPIIAVATQKNVVDALLGVDCKDPSELERENQDSLKEFMTHLSYRIMGKVGEGETSEGVAFSVEVQQDFLKEPVWVIYYADGLPYVDLSKEFLPSEEDALKVEGKLDVEDFKQMGGSPIEDGAIDGLNLKDLKDIHSMVTGLLGLCSQVGQQISKAPEHMRDNLVPTSVESIREKITEFSHRDSEDHIINMFFDDVKSLDDWSRMCYGMDELSKKVASDIKRLEESNGEA